MALQCGIVGLPNVGKSSLFNALTNASIAAENFPFCTIDPNVGVVPVPDSRLSQLADIVRPQKVISTVIEFVDIAGLVAGASKGEGLGNQFLARIREADAIAHVVRCFENEDIVHVSGCIDPLRDIDVIDTELLLADLNSVEKALQKATKAIKSGTKEAIHIKRFLEDVSAHLDSGLPVRAMKLSEAETLIAKDLHLLTGKSTMFIANVDETGFNDNPWLEKIQAKANEEGAMVVPVCAAMEAEIAQLEEEEKVEFLSEINIREPGLNRVARAGYQLLNLSTFFTTGVKELRAWTIGKNATAPQAAGAIHSDFEKGFIRAEVISYDDFIAFSGEQGAKEAGKWRLEGKNYCVSDGDVIRFRFNVSGK